MSVRKAALFFGVSKDSLNRRVNGKLKSCSFDERYKNVLGRYRAVLTHKREKELEDYILEMDPTFYGLSINYIRTVVFEYCRKNNIENNLTKISKWLVEIWFVGF